MMQDAKVRASISASQYRMQQQYATTTTTTVDEIRSTTTQCSNQCRLRFVGKWWALTQVALIAALCCAGHDLVSGGSIKML